MYKHLAILFISFLITACGGGGGGSKQTSEAKVTPPNEQPSLSINAPTKASYMELVEVTWSGSDSDGDSLTYSITAPDGLTDYKQSGTSISFVGHAVSKPTDLVFEISVNDGNSGSDTKQIIISLNTTTMITSSNLEVVDEVNKAPSNTIILYLNGAISEESLGSDSISVASKETNINVIPSFDQTNNTIKLELKDLTFGTPINLRVDSLLTTELSPIPEFSVQFESYAPTLQNVETGNIIPFFFSHDGTMAMGIQHAGYSDEKETLHVSKDGMKTWTALPDEAIAPRIRNDRFIPGPEYTSAWYVDGYLPYFTHRDKPSSIILHPAGYSCTDNSVNVFAIEITQKEEMVKYYPLLSVDDLYGECDKLSVEIHAVTDEGVIYQVTKHIKNSRYDTIDNSKDVTYYRLVNDTVANVAPLAWTSETFDKNKVDFRTTEYTADSDVIYYRTFVSKNKGNSWSEFGSRKILESRENEQHIYGKLHTVHPEKPGTLIYKNSYYSTDFGDTWRNFEEMGGQNNAGIATRYPIGFYDFGNGYQLTSVTSELHKDVFIHQWNEANNGWEEVFKLPTSYLYVSVYNIILSNDFILFLQDYYGKDEYTVEAHEIK